MRKNNILIARQCTAVLATSLASTLLCNQIIRHDIGLSDIYLRSIKSIYTVNSFIDDHKSLGTGFIYKGHLVTNAHVIDDGLFVNTEPEIKTSNIYIDKMSDIAIIDVDVKEGGLKRCTKEAEIGQDVIAIGSPFGLENTLTRGIVSGLHRDLGELEEAYLTDLIQIDAPVNPGNSGGPLLDAKSGCVLGMNTAIISPSGTNAGVGLVIPITSIDKAI